MMARSTRDPGCFGGRVTDHWRQLMSSLPDSKVLQVVCTECKILGFPARVGLCAAVEIRNSLALAVGRTRRRFVIFAARFGVGKGAARQPAFNEQHATLCPNKSSRVRRLENRPQKGQRGCFRPNTSATRFACPLLAET